LDGWSGFGGRAFVQGVASMTPFKVDGSAVTQPYPRRPSSPYWRLNGRWLDDDQHDSWHAMQTSGGSVSIVGTLPAFAATPTVNLGTIAGVATAANQTNGTEKLRLSMVPAM